MTTVPASGAISMSDINSAFSLGNSLNSYFSLRWYKSTNARGYLQSSGSISFSDFADTRSTSPVTAGSATYNSTQNIAFPMFNSLTVTVKGGNGGTNGIGGSCQAGGAGGAGGASSFGSYVSGAGGAGGGGTGTTASTSWTISDANQASILALYNTQAAGTVGSGGGGGATGYNSRAYSVCYSEGWNGYFWMCLAAYTAYACDSATGSGSAGANGYISLTWS